MYKCWLCGGEYNTPIFSEEENAQFTIAQVFEQGYLEGISDAVSSIEALRGKVNTDDLNNLMSEEFSSLLRSLINNVKDKEG